MHAVVQRAPSDLRGGPFRQHPRVLLATLLFSRKSTDKFTDPPCRHVPGAKILLRVLSTIEDQEAQKLFVEIQ